MQQLAFVLSSVSRRGHIEEAASIEYLWSLSSVYIHCYVAFSVETVDFLPKNVPYVPSAYDFDCVTQINDA